MEDAKHHTVPPDCGQFHFHQHTLRYVAGFVYTLGNQPTQWFFLHVNIRSLEMTTQKKMSRAKKCLRQVARISAFLHLIQPLVFLELLLVLQEENTLAPEKHGIWGKLHFLNLTFSTASSEHSQILASHPGFREVQPGRLLSHQRRYSTEVFGWNGEI